MYYAPAQQTTTIRTIARSAYKQIKNKTGMQFTMMLCPTETTLKTPEKMLRIVAMALDMSPGCYRMKTRVRNIAELRFIAAVLLRSNFPKITLHQIAAFFGGQDHTSVINGLTRAYGLIHTGDPRFLNKYNKALQSVNIWLRTEE
jgi:chromosomal replication initiation ATPase DnaA